MMIMPLHKAKAKDTGHWVIGNYYFDPRPNGGHYIISYNKYKEIITEIDENTLCQYINLSDRHKNKLWENDIVEIVSSPKTSYKYLLWWNKEMSLMDAIPLDGIEFNGSDYWNGKYPKFSYKSFCTMMQDPWGDFLDIKAIGNIFDNPELLRDKTDIDNEYELD